MKERDRAVQVRWIIVVKGLMVCNSLGIEEISRHISGT